MLVLTRKVEQKIRIGKKVIVTILRIQGEQVSVGIEAPDDVEIVREELLALDKIKKANSDENAKKEILKEIAEKVIVD